MSTQHPQRAILLTRISDARNGDERGVTDQQKDGRKLAKQLGWTVGRVIVENDTSAFKRRKVTLPDGRSVLRTVRPGFREALDLLAAGQADGLIAYDLDRACRDPRDLEDLIDVVEASTPRLPVESVTGSLRLANDADITMARVMVAVGNKSSRDTGRRVARAAQTRAENGKHHGGMRPYGFDANGMTVRPEEAAEIVRVAERLLAGTSMHRLVADLRKREVPTVTGAQCHWPRREHHDDDNCDGCRLRGRWTANALRQMLLSPRLAGHAVHQGEIVGKAAWPAILAEDVWRSVVDLLNDPARRTTPGNAVKWLGSGLYRCGECDGKAIMRVTQSGGGRLPTYRCGEHPGHLSRNAVALDRAVTAALVARLSKPDAMAALRTQRNDRQDTVDARAVAKKIGKLERRLHELAAELTDTDGRPVSQIRRAMDDVQERITDQESKLITSTRPDPLDGIAGKPDAAEIWVSLDLDRQRAILDLLVTVTVKKVTKRGRPVGSVRRPDGSYGQYLDPDSIQIEWK